MIGLLFVGAFIIEQNRALTESKDHENVDKSQDYINNRMIPRAIKKW